MDKTYIAIDLKSFFASVECAERGLDAMTTNLVVADESRTDKTICLAISPAMKKLGIKNRCRLFEIPDNVEYIIAPPRMKKYIEYSANIYEDAYINKNNKVVFAGATWDCDVTQLVKGAILDEEGYFITPNGKKYDLNDIDVIATIDMKDVQISDDLESGNITGQIIQMVWKGDHYQLIVRTEDEEDFIVDTEWTWNEFDTVSIKIDENKIKLKLKEDLAKYEI